jgi:hypothetical protein
MRVEFRGESLDRESRVGRIINHRGGYHEVAPDHGLGSRCENPRVVAICTISVIGTGLVIRWPEPTQITRRPTMKHQDMEFIPCGFPENYTMRSEIVYHVIKAIVAIGLIVVAGLSLIWGLL